MPFRRRSCDACFSGRRKCDLAFPVCGRCQRNKKDCRYVTSQTTDSNVSDVGSPVNQLASTAASVDFDSWGFDMAFDVDLNDSSLMGEFLKPNIPNMLGELGEVQPVSGNNRSWKWVIEQLKSYLRDFAHNAKTVFIHTNSVRNPDAGAIRAAFGICTAYVCMNEANEFMVFETLDAEMSKLLNSVMGNSFGEDLSRLQAIVLYQILRLFHGNVKQQALAEQQQTRIAAWGLQLLRRASAELRDASTTWENWILIESIRRTVMVAFIVHAVYSIFKHGVCPELPTLSVLPVSSKPAFWNSQTTYLQQYSEDETLKYPDFTSLWLISPPRKLDPFEKMILVACKGIEQVEALSCPDNIGQ